jgi:RimJ/RimL family protein N-acetyltransferase
MRYFRRLHSFDAEALAAHLVALDSRDRRSRFSAPVSDQAIRAYVAGIDWRRAAIIGCFDGATLIGTAELHLPAAGDASREGEFAVAVAPARRDEGLGSEFLRRVIVLARNRMLRRLRMVCLLDNGPMRRIARKFGGELDITDGQAWADLRLPFPDPLSLASEAYEESFGLAAAMQTRHGLALA